MTEVSRFPQVLHVDAYQRVSYLVNVRMVIVLNLNTIKKKMIMLLSCNNFEIN